MAVDSVVVGGGIGGAVLATLLGRGGKKVLVLEKSVAPPNWVRPEILWPATTRILADLLPQDVVERVALTSFQGIQFHDGQCVFSLVSPDILRRAGIQPWSTDPNQTREELLRHGAFELRRGVEVVGVLQEKHRVVGVRTRDVRNQEEHEVLADYTIGDDGANSVVRKACGLDMPTRMFPVEFFCFAFDWPAALRPGLGRFWINTRGPGAGIMGLLAIPLPGGQGAGLIPVRSRLFDQSRQVEDCWRRFCSADGTIQDVMQDRRFPQDLARVRRPWGHAQRYGADGAILIGDAIHPVSPAGGQGANMSVADARVVAELVLANHPKVLHEYERRRWPANQRSTWFTRLAAAAFGLPPWLLPASLGPRVFRWVSRHPWLARRFVQRAATAFQENSYE